jgi:hypothetical protein
VEAIQETQKLYTIRGAAQATGNPEFALRNWCKNGEIKHVKAGSRVYVTIEAINEFIQAGGVKNGKR